jgi:hypothetical protein
VYLHILSSNEKPPLAILLKNLPILLKLMLTAPARIHGLTKRVLQNRQIDPSGQIVGSVHKVLGLLYKLKKKRALALEHLTEAKKDIFAVRTIPSTHARRDRAGGIAAISSDVPQWVHERLGGGKLQVQPCPQCPCAVERRRFSSGCKSRPATAPAGSNRSSYGGNEMAEAVG